MDVQLLCGFFGACGTASQVAGNTPIVGDPASNLLERTDIYYNVLLEKVSRIKRASFNVQAERKSAYFEKLSLEVEGRQCSFSKDSLGANQVLEDLRRPRCVDPRRFFQKATGGKAVAWRKHVMRQGPVELSPSGGPRQSLQGLKPSACKRSAFRSKSACQRPRGFRFHGS